MGQAHPGRCRRPDEGRSRVARRTAARAARTLAGMAVGGVTALAAEEARRRLHAAEARAAQLRTRSETIERELRLAERALQREHGLVMRLEQSRRAERQFNRDL